MTLLRELPKDSGVIGVREIVKDINSGKIKRVIVAKNCPEFLKDKIKVKIEIFDGDQQQLGTKLGKPFPVAMIGYQSEKK